MFIWYTRYYPIRGVPLNHSEQYTLAVMAKSFNFTFIVRGKVQGVFFRKYTKIEADKLGIKGYVQNHVDGSVVGAGQTVEKQAMESFRHFLEHVGSPNSVIESCTFEFNEEDGSHKYDSFSIKY
ncbi:acylphosphatase, putative [Theileria equi strain WA]|uniref:acylphosphatase n=1 Tax=Theileria equi strain WA TaxID=1537102 RepID=L1LGB9_THEEQ|nr:acylphosphatase, putative [Theileria equi strain WA]EKX74285.1 acylphosphatase, putative [Theileria equi strain WA]|eukprot:XP_004833737.1 acylphosphatase, putative [Theileria equi strain WA]